MFPSYTTSVPPTLQSSVTFDNAYSRVLKVGKMNSLSLDSTKVVGTATLVAGTVDVTVPGIESTDLVFVSLHSIGGSGDIGSQYLVEFNSAVGNTPAFITITSYASNRTVENSDVSTVKYLIVKPYPVLT